MSRERPKSIRQMPWAIHVPPLCISWDGSSVAGSAQRSMMLSGLMSAWMIPASCNACSGEAARHTSGRGIRFSERAPRTCTARSKSAV